MSDGVWPCRAEMTSAGSGGTRLAQTISEKIGTPGSRLTSTLPTAQLNAPASASPSASGLRSPPTVSPIETSPAKAMAMPMHWRRLGMSLSTAADSSTVKKTCICCVTDASPGGKPASNAKNSSRNCPANRVAPIIVSAPQPMRGRGTNRIGMLAIRNRSAVSCVAEKLSRPSLVATKARPQITEVRPARIM